METTPRPAQGDPDGILDHEIFRHLTPAEAEQLRTQSPAVRAQWFRDRDRSDPDQGAPPEQTPPRPGPIRDAFDDQIGKMGLGGVQSEDLATALRKVEALGGPEIRVVEFEELGRMSPPERAVWIATELRARCAAPGWDEMTLAQRIDLVRTSAPSSPERAALESEDTESPLAALKSPGEITALPADKPAAAGLDDVEPAAAALGDVVEDKRTRRRAREEAEAIVADLRNRFTYHAPQAGQPARYEEIRGLGLTLALRMSAICPQSRELSLAITNLESAIFWANAAVARAAERTPGPEPLPHLHVKAPRDVPHAFEASPSRPGHGLALCATCGQDRTFPVHREPSRRTTDVGPMSIAMARVVPHAYDAGPFPAAGDAGPCADCDQPFAHSVHGGAS